MFRFQTDRKSGDGSDKALSKVTFNVEKKMEIQLQLLRDNVTMIGKKEQCNKKWRISLMTGSNCIFYLFPPQICGISINHTHYDDRSFFIRKYFWFYLNSSHLIYKIQVTSSKRRSQLYYVFIIECAISFLTRKLILAFNNTDINKSEVVKYRAFWAKFRLTDKRLSLE